ncbi:MAG: dihydrodipicolinate synthase family protein, partial [Clostridia bacterium]
SKATALQLEYLDLINDLFIETNPIPVKTAMNIMGMNVGELRLPLYKMNDKNQETLVNTLKRHKLV